MFRIHISSLLSILLVTISSSLWGQIDQYQYQRPITRVQSIGYHRIVLPPEVLSTANANLNDLRVYQMPVVDSLEAEEVPYLVELQQGEEEFETVPFRMINQGTKKNFSQAVLRKEKSGTINRIDLEISPANYDVKASIEGSENRLNWVLIKQDVRLVGISNEEVSYRYARLNFSDSDYRFFRVRLYDPSLQIEKATMKIWSQNEGIYQPYEIANWDVKNDTDKKITEIRVDLAGSYPVSRLQLDIGSTRDYFRTATLSYLKQRIKTEQGTKEIWRELGTATLSSLEEADIFTDLRSTDAVKITIQNYDNLPLNIQAVQVSGPVYELISELEVGNEYVLAYGNKDADKPRYDLVHFRNQISKDDLVSAGLGAEVVMNDPEEAERAKQAADEQARALGNGLLWVVMIFVIGVIGFVTVRMIRKQKFEQELAGQESSDETQ